MGRHIGKQSIAFDKNISIYSTSSIVGKLEGEGPLSQYFDIIAEDISYGQDTWEKAESKMVEDNIKNLIAKSGIAKENIDYIVTGDLLNQCCGSTYGIENLDIPFFGVYGACSTFGEAAALGSVLIESGGADIVAVGASSHFCSAERQFRFPLELGTQRPPTSTRTVTGDGAMLLKKDGDGPYIKAVTTGKIVDMGITDANNMGAAMAPACAELIAAHLNDFNLTALDYDLIVTGDLGYVGSELMLNELKKLGYDASKNHMDCGIEIYDRQRQDTHAGGSGCACSAVTFCGMLYDKLSKHLINKILLVPTGALMSPTSIQQGLSIAGIAHGVVIEGR